MKPENRSMFNSILILLTVVTGIGLYLTYPNSPNVVAARTTEAPTLNGNAALSFVSSEPGLESLREAIDTLGGGPQFWGQQARVTPADAGGGFGISVAISGDTAVVGARSDSSSRGAAYVFVRNGSSWSQQTKLVPSHSSPEVSQFGTSVSISGETIAVGAPSSQIPGTTGRGSAYLFVRSGATWSEQQRILAPDSSSETLNFQFGESIGLSGNTVIVGAKGAQNFRGAAYAFVRTGSTWSFQQKLTASDGSSSDTFGDSIAIDAETAVIGASFDDTGSITNHGSAYVFARVGVTWAEQQKLTAFDQLESGFYGTGVAISGNTIVVGSSPLNDIIAPTPGGAYVYVRSGSFWALETKLLGCNIPRDLFGGSVGIDGDRVIVGREIPVSTPPGLPAGSTYFFARSSGSWTMTQREQGPAGAVWAGNGVGIGGGTAISGSFRDAGANLHAAYIFALQAGSPQQNPCASFGTPTPTPSPSPTSTPVPTPSPTPSTSSITGSVTTPAGQGLRNALVSLIDGAGVRRFATTSSFGIYSFADVPNGSGYILTVSSKRYRFSPKNLNINGNVTGVDFIGLE